MPTPFQQQVPSYVLEVCQQLQDAKHEAYIVGGALRDLALGLPPKDFDIATSATPAQVEQIFAHTAPTGKKYGTITVILEGGQVVEVTTYRKDAICCDGRRPDMVTFSHRLKDDLAHRDFTINAIAYDPLADRVEDPSGGLQDIEAQLLRTVGEAGDRLREDALRMMRAVRIKAEKGFTLTEPLAAAIREHAQLIDQVSRERIADELCRIITSSRPTAGVYDLMELGLLQYILPELQSCVGVEQRQDYHMYDVFGHIAHSLQYTKPDLVLRLALLLHDIGKPPTTSVDKKGVVHFYGHEMVSAKMALPVLKRLKFSNQIQNEVLPLIKNHMHNVESDKALRKLMSELKSAEQARRFAEFRYADKMAGRRNADLLFTAYEANLARIDQMLADKVPLQVADLSVTGEDIMQTLSIIPGPVVGSILEHLLKLTLDKPELNRYEVMLEMVPEIYARRFARPPVD